MGSRRRLYIAAARVGQGLTQEKLAGRINEHFPAVAWTHNRVSLVERGELSVGPKDAIAVAAALNVNLVDIIDGSPAALQARAEQRKAPRLPNPGRPSKYAPLLEPLKHAPGEWRRIAHDLSNRSQVSYLSRKFPSHEIVSEKNAEGLIDLYARWPLHPTIGRPKRLPTDLLYDAPDPADVTLQTA